MVLTGLKWDFDGNNELRSIDLVNDNRNINVIVIRIENMTNEL